MSWGTIWLILSVYGNVQLALGILLIIIVVVAFFLAIFYPIIIYESGLTKEDLVKYTKKYLVIPCLVLVPVYVFLPSKKDVMITIALYASQKPAEQVIADMGALYPKIKTLIEQELSDLIKEEKPKGDN